jgi:hypothetical protein
MSSNPEQRNRSELKASDRSQLKSLLDEINDNWNKKQIEQVLEKLPPPPPDVEEESKEEGDKKELIAILRGIHDAFGPKNFWKELRALGYQKGTPVVPSIGQEIISLGDIVTLHIQGRYEGSAASRGKMDKDFSDQEWEIKMLEDGFVRIRFRGQQQTSSDFFDSTVTEGDIVKASGAILNIIHVKQPMVTAPRYSPSTLPNFQP